MNIQELLNYLQRSSTDVLGSLPSMYGAQVSPTPIPDSDNADYDMIGWQLKNGGPRLGPLGGHFTDEFKLPNHPTFSNESRYSNNMLNGGEWLQNGMAFNPSAFNEKTNGLAGIVKYLSKSDPGAQLLELPALTEDRLNTYMFMRDYILNRRPGFHGTLGVMGELMKPMFDRTPKLSNTLESLFTNEKYFDVDKYKKMKKMKNKKNDYY